MAPEVSEMMGGIADLGSSPINSSTKNQEIQAAYRLQQGAWCR